MKDFKRVDILGCPFDAISFDETLEVIKQAILEDFRIQIVPGSIDFVVKARKDQELKDILWRSDLIVADGVPIVWAAILLGDPIRGRVSGTDLVWHCAEISSLTQRPVALIGGAGNVAERAAIEMKKYFKDSKPYAFDTPFPLTASDSEKLVSQIRDLKAGIVLVALGAPRQEKWVQTYLAKSGANVGIGVGSAFDIISGDKPRAPGWMKDHGLEWLHRMFQEPKRLGKRYLIDDSPFLLYLIAEIFKRKLLNRRA